MTSKPRSAAQALASRSNRARSRGRVSAAGKARAARNALKHGLRARVVTLEDEDAAAFEALDAAFRAELQPESELQNELVARIVLAAWRGRRADRIESDLFARHLDLDAGSAEGNLGAALVRDGYGPRVVETLLRYRASVHSDFFRALGALRVLQGHEDAEEDARARTPALEVTAVTGLVAPRIRPRAASPQPAADRGSNRGKVAPCIPVLPNEPEEPLRINDLAFQSQVRFGRAGGSRRLSARVLPRRRPRRSWRRRHLHSGPAGDEAKEPDFEVPGGISSCCRRSGLRPDPAVAKSGRRKALVAFPRCQVVRLASRVGRGTVPHFLSPACTRGVVG